MKESHSAFHIALRHAQRQIIGYALETAEGDWHLACSRLGLSVGHFRYYCEQLGFPIPEATGKVGASRRGAVKPVELPEDAVVDLTPDPNHGQHAVDVEPTDEDHGDVEDLA